MRTTGCSCCSNSTARDTGWTDVVSPMRGNELRHAAKCIVVLLKLGKNLSFNPELELIADPSIGRSPELYFNAARLDRSIALRTEDYLAIARPRLAPVAEPATSP